MRTKILKTGLALGLAAAVLLEGGAARADAAGNKALKAYEKMINPRLREI